MAIYEYENDQGHRRELVMGMTDPRPERIIIFEDGSFQDAAEPVRGDDRVRQCAEHGRAILYSRVYGTGLGVNVVDLACKPGSDGLPVSHASPRRSGGKIVKRGDHTLREHSDGTVTNLVGQPVIDSNHAARRNADSTGMEID